MLRPTDTATRERKSLTGIWRFRLDAAGEGLCAEWFKRVGARNTMDLMQPADTR